MNVNHITLIAVTLAASSAWSATNENSNIASYSDVREKNPYELLGPSIQLNPMIHSDTLKIETVKNIVGTCGPAIISVDGVSIISDSDTFAMSDSSRVVMRSYPNELILSVDNGMIDLYSGLACVETNRGSMLLIWSVCGYGGCDERKSFYVINPSNLKVLAGPDPKNGACRSECAAKVIGDHFPKSLYQ